MASARKFWLFKSEESCFSIRDLASQKQKTTFWDGVRNYQARNFLRDDVQLGDGILFYHSNSDPLAVVGTAKVVKTAYPDHTAFDPQEGHYDPKSDPENPTWYMVDIKLVQEFPTPLLRTELLKAPKLKQMELLRRGSRLSIQPVTPAEWAEIHRLAGVKDPAP
jgi:predicted RNA-binding protein with PUA-like domain